MPHPEIRSTYMLKFRWVYIADVWKSDLSDPLPGLDALQSAVEAGLRDRAQDQEDHRAAKSE
jgi:hypothetical protein